MPPAIKPESGKAEPGKPEAEAEAIKPVKPEDKKKAQAAAVAESQEYVVNVELSDQNNNIFFIEDVNYRNGANITLKDSDWPDISGRSMKMNRDIYYIDNSVIQELKSIFKYMKKIEYTIPSSDKKESGVRYPTDISHVKEIMEDSTDLAELHKIFTKKPYVRVLRDNIINFSSGAYQNDRRIAPINKSDTINKIVSDNYKYIYNTKKTSDFDDDEIKDALMFNNIMYIVKNIFFKKETILTNIKKEKYYVDEILFYDLPFIHMKKKDYDTIRNVTIYLKVKTTLIIDIPIIKIHYVIDDLEIPSIKITAPTLLYPKDIDADLSSFNTMYIFNNIKYKTENDNMNAFFTSLKNEKRVNKMLELFVNSDIVNMYRKRFPEKPKKEIIKETEKKKEKKEEEEEKKKEKEKEKEKKEEKKEEEKEEAEEEEEEKENRIVTENIIYLLREKFKLFDNNVLINKNLIDDTYIVYYTNPTQTQTQIKYHSIMANKKYDKYDNSTKNESIKTILTQHLKRFSKDFSNNNFFYNDDSSDKRLNNNVYNIVVIFRTYKSDDINKKPSLMRRYIGDECLSNANIMDNIFSKIMYRTLGLPDKFLYDKFININRSRLNSAAAPSATAPSAAAPSAAAPSAAAPSAPNKSSIKKGGSPYNTRKYNTRKYNIGKYNTRKYNIRKYNTRKYNIRKSNSRKYNIRKSNSRKYNTRK